MSILPNCVYGFSTAFLQPNVRSAQLRFCIFVASLLHREHSLPPNDCCCCCSPKSAPANLEMHKTVVAVIVFVGEMQYNCKRKSANGHWAEWTKRTIGLFLFVYSSTVPVWMADNWVVICSLYQLYYSCPQPDYGKVFVSSSESAAGGGQDFARQLRYFSAGGRHTNQAIKDECRVLRTEGREPL